MKSQKSPLSHILVSSDDKNWEKIVVADEIHNAIIKENKSVLKSASQSLPSSEVFRDVFGDYGETKEASKLVNGYGLPEECDISKEDQTVLAYLAKPKMNDD